MFLSIFLNSCLGQGYITPTLEILRPVHVGDAKTANPSTRIQDSIYFFLYSAYIHTSSTVAYLQSAHIQTIIQQPYIGNYI